MNDILFTIAGYVTFTVYTVGIMVIGILVEKKTALNSTMVRKFTHIISSLTWIICCFFFGYSIHWVILNGIGAVIIGAATVGGAMKSYYNDGSGLGIFYFGLSTFIVALICYLIGEEVYLYTGIAYYCLALGDGFAPIVAKLLRKYNVEIMPGKTVFGSLTVFVLSFLSTLTFSLVFDMQLDMLFIFSVAALSCIMEFYGLKGIDNLLIEFSVFGYLLLYHFGYVTPVLEIVVLASPFIACLAVGLKGLTVSGGICGMVLFYLVAFFGKGYVPVVAMSILFVVATIVSFITQKLLNRRSADVSVKYARTGKQLIAVGMVAVICLILYYFTDLNIFLSFYFLSLTEQFADSMASDIGRLTRGKNLDIIRLKPVDKGISGGVSLLGTLCALISSILLLFVPLAFRIISLTVFFVVVVIAFAGTLIDSVLGSLFQALYVCEVCGKTTESEVHCDCKTQIVKGFKWMDNATVNLLTSCLTCALGTLLLLL